MRSAHLRHSFVVLCAAGVVPLAAVACHGDGRDPGANSRAATYVTPASNLPAPVVAPATNTPTAATTTPASTSPAAPPRAADTTARDTTRAPNRAGTPPANAPAPMRS